MANRQITALTSLTAPATGDVLPIVDISEALAANKNKKITYGELLSSAPSGSAAAPSFSFDSDPNTGIFNPAADTLAFAEGGVEVMRIDSAGNVGIGVTPTVSLDIFRSASNPSEVRIRNANDGTLQLYTASTSSVIGTVGATPLAFRTNATERLRITSAGLVGIGTSSPSTTLDVGITGGMVRAGGGSGNNLIQAYTGSVGLGMWAGGNPRFYSTGNMIFSVNATIGTAAPTGYTDALTITSAGLVGIGTTSPGFNLEVSSSAATTIKATSTETSGSSFARLFLEYTGSGGSNTQASFNVGSNYSLLGVTTAHPLILTTSNTERARIDSSGRLLVGTSTDSGGALFQVNGDRIRVGTAKTPASASATGTAGEICWDANYIYVCTATNTWKRTAIATW